MFYFFSNLANWISSLLFGSGSKPTDEPQYLMITYPCENYESAEKNDSFDHENVEERWMLLYKIYSFQSYNQTSNRFMIKDH